MDLEKLYKETNEKFVGRMENLLYSVNGCDTQRGRIILEMCLKRNERRFKMDAQKIDRKQLSAQEIINESINEKLTEEEIKEVEVKANKEIEKEVKEIVSKLKE